MDRRQLISAVAVTGAAASGLALASAAQASSGKSEGAAEAEKVDLPGMALPVIVDGRIKNYVFVGLRLHLAAGKPADEVRAKAPYYRDGLVRTAHRTSLAVADDWNRLSEAGITGAIMAIARLVSGAGVVERCEIVAQTPRRRLGTPTA